jgi:hypothetical protein
MNYWESLIVEAVIYTTTLFIAHAFWLNRDVIEPAMAQHKRGSYVAGFAYYATALALAIFAIRKTIK